MIENANNYKFSKTIRSSVSTIISQPATHFNLGDEPPSHHKRVNLVFWRAAKLNYEIAYSLSLVESYREIVKND